MQIGVILAAGRGTRLQSKDKNKTALPLKGKALVEFGVELFQATVDKTMVVVGAFSNTVKEALERFGDTISFIEQTEQLGTGHAAKVAIEYIEEQGLEPTELLLGYGDHMMFYTTDIIERLKSQHIQNKAAVTLVTVEYPDADSLGWGRIVRGLNGEVEAIVEQKDATKEQRAITEQNAGFYCFDYQFIKNAVQKFEKSKVSGEYYITDAVELARKAGKRVDAFTVPFENVGTGVNTPEQLAQTQEMIEN